MVMLDGGQLDLEGWKTVFGMASPRLELVQVNRPDGDINSIMVLEIEDEVDHA